MAAEVKGIALNTPRVAIAVGSKIRLLAAIIGVLRTGRSVVLVNTHLPLDAIRVNLQDAAVKAMLYDESNPHIANLVSSSVAAPKSVLPASSAVPLQRREPGDEWGGYLFFWNNRRSERNRA
jgi:acyl-CoA synthetase (AMP-forming)/AMP-acid ligase II